MILETYTKPYYTYELSEKDEYLRVRIFASDKLSVTREAIYKFMDARTRTEKSLIEDIIEKIRRKVQYWDDITGNHHESIEIQRLKGKITNNPRPYFRIKGFFKSLGMEVERIYQRASKEESDEIQRQFQ